MAPPKVERPKYAACGPRITSTRSTSSKPTDCAPPRKNTPSTNSAPTWVEGVNTVGFMPRKRMPESRRPPKPAPWLTTLRPGENSRERSRGPGADRLDAVRRERRDGDRHVDQRLLALAGRDGDFLERHAVGASAAAAGRRGHVPCATALPPSMAMSTPSNPPCFLFTLVVSPVLFDSFDRDLRRPAGDAAQARALRAAGRGLPRRRSDRPGRSPSSG
jgi:hypothetical protein